jgi:3-oxoacyl-[acyl-carrier-protein] synthase-3
MVFGDAATATLIESGNDTINFLVESDGSGASKLIIPYGGFRNKSTEHSSVSYEREDGNWRSDDDLYMDGISIVSIIVF